MLKSPNKRFILPFSPQKSNASESEAAAVFAVAEFERNKGGGLITRQPEEKLVFLSKVGYPLWLFPKNNTVFFFDGFGNSSYSVSYFEVPSAKMFMENLEMNSRPRENYVSFLSDHGNYFQMSMKEKQFVFRSLIADVDFRGEFNVYRKEAVEITAQTNVALILPALEESAISSMLAEFDRLESGLREESERLPECIRIVNKTTSQYITELDYEAAAAREEADAKIRAQEELVIPKVAKLNKEYKYKTKNLVESFDRELESLETLRAKTLRFIGKNEGKIKVYQHEANVHASKNQVIYEKRWKEKIRQTQKELNGLKKELKNIEDSVKKLSKQKARETSKLNFELDAEVKLARQPLLELEVTRDAKIHAYKLETDKLLKLEKQVLEDLTKSIKLREAIKANFEGIGTRDQGLKSSALFYVPFYVACYEMGVSRRYLIIPPSTISSVDFSVKLKGALGLSKIKDMLSPRFKAITTLIEKVQAVVKENAVFEDQLSNLSQRNNLLNDCSFKENVEKGSVFLKYEGWISDKEHQVLSNRLTVQS